MKHIRISQLTSVSWLVPVEPVAKARANYYANSDQDRYGLSRAQTRELYKKELALGLEDETELLDWIGNNMDDEEIRALALPVPEPPQRLIGAHRPGEIEALHRVAAELDQLVERGQQHLGTRGLQHQRVAGVVDVLAGAGEVHELARRLQLDVVVQALLEPVLDRLDVVLGDSLGAGHLLDLLGAELVDNGAQPRLLVAGEAAHTGHGSPARASFLHGEITRSRGSPSGPGNVTMRGSCDIQHPAPSAGPAAPVWAFRPSGEHTPARAVPITGSSQPRPHAHDAVSACATGSTVLPV